MNYETDDATNPVYPYPEDGDANRPTKRFRLGVAGGFLAALVLVAGVGVYFAVNAMTDKEPFSINGILSLRSDSITTSGLPNGFACAGKGGYNDLGPGTAVTVTDEGGTLLAKGKVDSSFGESKSCTFAFTINEVPAESKFYKVQVSHRGEMSYTEQEARGRVDLNLGDGAPEPTAAPPPPAPASSPPVAAPAAAPAPRGPVPADPRPETVPAYSTQCSSGVAVGSSRTSCAFAQVVRESYLANSRGGGSVVIYPYSPVTGKTYQMTCSGRGVVTCTGGDNAVVYIY